jgi:hypothetical protein
MEGVDRGFTAPYHFHAGRLAPERKMWKYGMAAMKFSRLAQ